MDSMNPDTDEAHRQMRAQFAEWALQHFVEYSRPGMSVFPGMIEYQVLLRCGADAAGSVVPALTGVLRERAVSAEWQLMAAEILATIGPAASDARSVLLVLATQSPARRHASELAAIAVAPDAADEALILRVASQAVLSAEVCRALAAVGPRARVAESRLLRGLTSDTYDVRAAAAAALDAIRRD